MFVGYVLQYMSNHICLLLYIVYVKKIKKQRNYSFKAWKHRQSVLN